MLTAIRKLRIKLIWYNTQLTRSVARGPRASQPCNRYIKRRRIKLIWYNTQLTRSVARGPRASQC